MTFPELLLSAIERSEIPLRFEPGAAEAMAKPITEMLQGWISLHLPQVATDEAFDAGRRSLVAQLLAEMDGSLELPG